MCAKLGMLCINYVQMTEGLNVSIMYGARAATAPGGCMQACKPL